MRKIALVLGLCATALSACVSQSTWTPTVDTYGSSRAQYESIFNRLLKLPEETLVFPAHDYKGDTVSTIGEEKRYNPRLQVRSVDEYVELMANLKLANPKMMDVAVPANMHVGLHQEDLVKQGLALTAAEAIARLGRPEILLVDLREAGERAKHGVLTGALHAPYPSIEENLKAGGMLRELLPITSGRRSLLTLTLRRPPKASTQPKPLS